jgi:hypothetical protein
LPPSRAVHLETFVTAGVQPHRHGNGPGDASWCSSPRGKCIRRCSQRGGGNRSRSGLPLSDNETAIKPRGFLRQRPPPLRTYRSAYLRNSIIP